MGLIMSIFGLASSVGSFVGGWITDHCGWRWIFYINLPFGVLAAAAFVVTFFLKEIPLKREEHSTDNSQDA